MSCTLAPWRCTPCCVPLWVDVEHSRVHILGVDFEYWVQPLRIGLLLKREPLVTTCVGDESRIAGLSEKLGTLRSDIGCFAAGRNGPRP